MNTQRQLLRSIQWAWSRIQPPVRLPRIIAIGWASARVAMARPRSLPRYQNVRYSSRPGKRPASAMPRAIRAMYRCVTLSTNPVTTVTRPQLMAIRASHSRAPTFFSMMLLGTSRPT